MSKETNSKDTTDKKDEDVAAKNKDLQTLKGEVDIVKQYIKSKAEKEAKDTAKTTKETKEANYQKNRLSNTIKGLSGLEGLNLGLGQQSFKKR
jgi:hypothetical protein